MQWCSSTQEAKFLSPPFYPIALAQLSFENYKDNNNEEYTSSKLSV
jgi:hypothetical protein